VCRFLHAEFVAITMLLIIGGYARIVAAKDNQLVITGARIYSSPTAPPLEKGTIIIRDRKIAEVQRGPHATIPRAERVINANGLIVTAGFWNCHVHFTEPHWHQASERTDTELTEHLHAMLTRYGFTSVVDTGSDLANTLALKQRIAHGVKGPQILLASGSFVAENGSPAYLEVKLPELTSPEHAEQLTKAVLADGAHAIKIFTGSFLGVDQVALMPLPIIKAVTTEAHRQGKLVVAHPQSLQGVELALDGGVDILAHTAPQSGVWPEALVTRLVRSGVGLMPTLQLWRFELTRNGAPPAIVTQFESTSVAQLRAFAAAGGEVLFGTGVGYMTDYDPTAEYQRMAAAGMSFEQILASLTTSPVHRFADSARTGTVESGRQADLVILAADPEKTSENFTSVRYTIRGGEVIYEQPHTQ
jgi:imidazolonepropionase-like amidohydrolase